MESLLRDLRFGLRTLWKSPGFAAVAVLVLALGTGANTAIFSLANGIFFRTPAVKDPGRLVWVMVRAPFSTRPQDLSYPDYLDLRDRSPIGVGLLLAAGLTRVLAGMLFGITPTDLVTFAGVALLLAGVSAFAGYVPARRAARVDPMTALRCE